MKKTFSNLFIKLCAIFLILGIIGYSLLCLVYTLPVEPMQQNLRESCSIFESEGTYKCLISGYEDTQLDNFTDALMLIEAAFKSNHHPMVAAVLNERPSIAEAGSPTDVLLAIYRDNVESLDIKTYGRYWHGYEIFLKPLLCIFNFGQIRNILCAVEIALVFCVVALLVHRKSAKYMLPFAAMWIYLNPSSLFMSLQFSNMFILTLVSFAVILLLEQHYAHNTELWIIHFFVVGCLTSYFDFLTYPVITLGVPIAYLISKHCCNFKDSMLSLIQSSIAWGVGYVGFWAAKWVGGSIVSRTNILMNAIRSVATRSSHEALEQTLAFWDVVQRNNDVRGNFMNLVIILSVIIVICALVLKFRFEYRNLVLLLVGIYPLVWYSITLNHAYIHFWFTYREFGITIFALLTFAVSMKRNDFQRHSPVPQKEVSC